VAKSSTVTLTKTASTTEDTNDDQQSTTTAVGDTVNYTVSTTIPGYGNVYEHPHFTVTDKLTALKLNKDSVAVTGLTKGEAYTVAATDDGYTITFTETYLKGLKAATNVEITYSAIVTSAAQYAINEENNDVYIEYSHNPNSQSDYDMKKDTTQHYTFTLDASGMGSGENQQGKRTSELVKVGIDANGDPITTTEVTSQVTTSEKWEGPLQGAVFGLFTDSGATTPYMAKNADGTAGTTAMTATTDGDGRMSFAGLDAGTYYLKEISAPAGYVTDSHVYTVVITAQTDTVKVTEWWNGTAWVSEKPTSGTAKEVTYDTEILKSYTVTIDGKAAATYTFNNAATANSNDIVWEDATIVEKPFQFKNTKGTELPSTGGIGTKIFYTMGAVLVVGAGVVLVSRKRAGE
jgi:fimbrial isopeptide formation D2 family protein/LPXTG-motif cell wall-anchored protein